MCLAWSSTGTKNVGIQEALHGNALTQYGDWVGETEVTHLNERTIGPSVTNVVVHNEIHGTTTRKPGQEPH